MPRITGFDIPDEKKISHSLRYIYGIGPKAASSILENSKVDPEKRARDLTADEINKITKQLEHYVVGGQLRRIVREIEDLTIEHRDKREYFIKELAEGIGQIAAAFWPREVIVRFSDFKTNEYRNLIGGELFEGEEANPMLGFRGACRYLDKKFQPVFKMECQAIKRVRELFGLKNVSVMVPFCRTVEEGRAVVKLIEKFGLGGRHSKTDGFKVYVMAEIPSNVILIV